MIDSLLAEITSLGWLFNNCYQREDHSWRVNLRRPDPDNLGDYFTSWAEAPTLVEALEDCMIKMIDAEFTPSHQPKASAAEGRSLLAKLGLAPAPRPTVERRI